MVGKDHHYQVTTTWTGNTGTGTSGYRDYTRDHEVTIDTKAAPLLGSSDPTFRGDPTRYNPEELLLTSLSQCHMLSYLHVCAVNKIIVTAYVDHAEGTMVTDQTGGRFTEVILKPEITITAESDAALAETLHEKAQEACFIAASVNFPVRHQPTVRTEA
jgi:organic hydroperoxide reductase OsmC/OhrA